MKYETVEDVAAQIDFVSRGFPAICDAAIRQALLEGSAYFYYMAYDEEGLNVLYRYIGNRGVRYICNPSGFYPDIVEFILIKDLK